MDISSSNTTSGSDQRANSTATNKTCENKKRDGDESASISLSESWYHLCTKILYKGEKLLSVYTPVHNQYACTEKPVVLCSK